MAYFTTHFREDGWSPDAAVGRAKAEGLYLPDEMVCTATLYNYIEAQLLEVRNIDLLEKTGQRVKHKANHKFKRMLTGRSIDERPKRVDNRKEFGNFELDTVVGKRNGQESVLMTLIERKTRFQFVRLIDSRDADSVNHAMHAIVKDHGDVIRPSRLTMAQSSQSCRAYSMVWPTCTTPIHIAPASAEPTRPTTECSGGTSPKARRWTL
uniref:IS30 family transposase n=1 Tax=Lacticaseibacillus suibinensis TaxID=2486011 RepID=UPI0022E14F3E|nr:MULTISPECIES: IS30 family transposase [Lacticaseibacillus]